MHNLASIKRIVKAKTGMGVARVEEKHEGFDNEVYMIYPERGRELVLKFPTRLKSSRVITEAWAFKKWSGLGVPVPRALGTGRYYVLEEALPGTAMRNAHLSREQKHRAMRDLGRYAKRMHSVKTRGYGYLVREGVGGKKTWRDFMDPFFDRIMVELKFNRIVSDSLLNKAMTFYVQYVDVLDFHDPRLLHADLTQDNLMINRGRLSGIIDASSAFSGDPMFDVAVVNQNSYGTGLMEGFLEGYGKVDEERVSFYSLYQSVWLAHFAGVQAKRPAEARQAVESMKHYLGI